MLMSQQLNYVLDTSSAIQTECRVVDKETRSGYKSGTSYYLHICVNGQIIKTNTYKAIYHQYDVGDPITLFEHTGALGFTYYEYQFEEVYCYKDP